MDQTTQERLMRGETRVSDSLVRLAESFSGTFRDAGRVERAATAEGAQLARKLDVVLPRIVLVKLPPELAP